jgi:hypothetical protein
MNSIARPPVDSRGRFGDDLDELLREFFQAEMPRSVPAFQPPFRLAFPPARPVRSWGPRFRTALALAASIAVLAIGLGLLSGKFETAAPRPAVSGQGGAERKPKIKNESILVDPESGKSGYQIDY